MDAADPDELNPSADVPDSPRNAQSTQRSVWLLTAVMVLAPLLMLATIWVLTLFRVNRP